MNEEQSNYNLKKNIKRIDRKVTILNKLNLIIYIVLTPFIVLALLFFFFGMMDIPSYNPTIEATVDLIDFDSQPELKMTSTVLINHEGETDSVTFSELYWCGNGEKYHNELIKTGSIKILLMKAERASLILNGQHYIDYIQEERDEEVNTYRSRVLISLVMFLVLTMLLFGINWLLNLRLNSLVLRRSQLLSIEFKKVKGRFVLKFIMAFVIAAISIIALMLFG